MYYYGARWYDPALGRFIQADTIVPNPGDPQAYDRYAYVNNNPLKYIDPSGHCGMLAEVGESFTSPFGQTCLGMNAGLSRRAKAALSAGGGLTAVATLNAGLATGSPPSQADPLPPLLEAVPGQTAGASSTSFPLAEGGPQTSIPPSTAVYNDTLNLLTDPLPGVEPTGHIYASWLGTNVTIVGTKSTPRLRGYQEAVSESTGGLASAQSLYENLTGGQPDVSNLSSLAPTNVFIQPGKIEVRFRPNSASGTPVIEVVNHADKTYEKIHFVE